MPHLDVWLFGYPRFLLDGKTIKFERRKTLALAAYLAASQQTSGRDKLAALFWEDSNQEQASAYLRQALWDFQRAVGEGWLLKEGASIGWNPQADAWVDMVEFTHLLGQAKKLPLESEGVTSLWEKAVGLAQDDFLAGFSLRDSPNFDNWQTIQTEGLKLEQAKTLEALAEAYAQDGRFASALEQARRWLAMDPLNEAAHRCLMRIYERSGQRALALLQYETCQQMLEAELGVAPEEETCWLYQQISQRPDAGSLRANRLACAPVRLPQPATPFVGRKAELARISELLQLPDCRLVSLVGIGGCGKTRLAVEAAGREAEKFSLGACFVDLALAYTEMDLFRAIYEALGLGELLPGVPGLLAEEVRNHIFRYLQDKQLLLVFDNFEQLSTQSGLLSVLLRAAPGVKLIVTSRERLNLREEWMIEVQGLAYPGSREVNEAPGFAAVELFVKVAERSGCNSLAKGDWEPVVRICQLLEGIPLGIELAGAWTRLISCQEIAIEIEHSLDFLTSRWRGMPERHRTLRLVFEHSWQLLSEAEQDALQRLSVFQSSFNREAALAVAKASLATLAGLVDKSFLRRLSSGRYAIHPVLKQYTFEKLTARLEIKAETEAYHAQYYTDWLIRMGEQLKGPRQMEALISLRTEAPDLVLAWCWLVAHNELQKIRLALPAMILFYEMHGAYGDVNSLLSLTIDWLHKGPWHPEDRILGEGLLGLAVGALWHFSRQQECIDSQNSLQKESLDLAQNQPDNREKAMALLLNSIGPGVLPPVATIEVAGKSAGIFEKLGDEWGTALAKLVLADTANFGGVDLELARRHYTASLEIFQRLQNDWGRALCYVGLAHLDLKSGSLPEAADSARQSLEIYERMENPGRLFFARQTLGLIAEAMGEVTEARQCYAANLAYARELGDAQQQEFYAEKLKGFEL